MNIPAFRWPLALAAVTLCCAAFAQPTAPPNPQGRWITGSGNLEVEVAPCGPAWCGTVTRVIANHSMNQGGEAMKPVDTRPALGMKILSDFQLDGSGDVPTWRGQIYNRENGKTYACLMSLDGQGGLVVRPYIGLPLFGKTQVWRRP